VQLIHDPNLEILGGGLWKIDNENKSLTFFSDSYDYGYPKYEDIKECCDNNKVFNHPADINDISDFINWNFKYSSYE